MEPRQNSTIDEILENNTIIDSAKPIPRALDYEETKGDILGNSYIVILISTLLIFLAYKFSKN